MAERVDLLVVGAGPAGATAARFAAQEGLRVLLVEQRPTIGWPVQCAEYIPAQIGMYVPVPERCIAQRVRTMRTHLPNGEIAEISAPGYVLHRALFDQSLAIAARRAGAEIWTAARAIERTERGVLVRRGGRTVVVEAQVVLGADGPLSTVGRWIGQTVSEVVESLQVEVVLPAPQEATSVYFAPAYPGGYAWVFPKGETANVGVGVRRSMGGDPRLALEHFLDRLGIGWGAVVGRTGGLIPCGGPVARMVADSILLAGDAAGQTHPITGAGIFAAVVGGMLAGQAAARAVKAGDLSILQTYEAEWASFMAGPLRHALQKRRQMEGAWTDDLEGLSALIRQTWIAFRDYARRKD